MECKHTVHHRMVGLDVHIWISSLYAVLNVKPSTVQDNKII